MRLSSDTLRKELADIPKEEQAIAAIKMVIEAAVTYEKIQRLHHELYLLQAQYNNNVRDVNLQISELRKECKHRECRFYGDPSGNNDSYYCCQICGAEDI